MNNITLFSASEYWFHLPSRQTAIPCGKPSKRIKCTL